MFIIRCDKCGEEKTVKSLLPNFDSDSVEQAEVPKYSIIRTDEDGGMITLCKSCENKLEKWLNDE